MAMADPDKEFEVEPDASDYAIGGQLSQRGDDGKLHPVAFYSKKLNGPELNYQIHDKELMAIIKAFKEWKHYLSKTTHPVKVYTDHKNLTSFTKNKELNKRQVRWAEFLTDYNFVIIYRKGSDNGRTNALSRRVDHFQVAPKETHAILATDKDGNLIPAISMYATFKVNTVDTWTNKIKAATHPHLQDLFHDPTLEVREFEDIVKYKGKRWIPEELRDDLIKDYHELPFQGHIGVFKTLKRIQQKFDCANLRQHVQRYIKNYNLCNKAKASRHKPYGELQPIVPPDRAWKSVAIDFIVKLPLSKEPMTGTEYDSILVITERLTKYAYFIPYKEASNAKELAYTILRVVISQHGLPDEFISDRDKLFTSKFWKSLMTQLGVKHKLSTAYHP
ncbi:hypothetical protein TruAng_012334 [Truncatella angustata]|nr:hypothetical protein TruAng_012334 [Truncatella angustata]